MSFARDSISIFLTRIIIIVLSTISSILVARMLGASLRGDMEILLLMPALLVSFGNLGIGNANLHFAGKNKYPIESIVSNSIFLTLVLGAMLIFLAYIYFITNTDRMFRGIPLYYAHIVFSIIPFLLFQRYIQYTLLGKEDIRSRNAIILLPALVNFIFIITVIFFRWGLLGVLAASAVSNLFAFFLCLYFISGKTRVEFGFNYKLFLDSVAFGIIPFLSLLVMNLNFQIDKLLLKYFCDSAVLGHYSIAVTIVEKFWLLPEAIGLVLFARISNTSEREANRITPLLSRFSFLVTGIWLLILAAVARPLIPFMFGKEFAPSVGPLLYLIPGTIMMSSFLILNSDLTGRGKAKITLGVFTCALIINIVLNLVLIPKYGAQGAAVASTLSYSLGSVALATIFSTRYSIPMAQLFLLQKGDIRTYALPFMQKNKVLLSSKQ